MSESEANRRIAAARVVQQFPSALGSLERGDVHLCALYALRKHLTGENHEELLRAATGKSTSEVEAMVAARFPRADVPSCIAPVQVQGPLPVAASVPPSERPSGPSAQPVSLLPPVPEPRPRIEPLSATRYRIEVTVSDEIRSTLERIKDLMRHRNPTGDLEIILEASLGLLLEKLERERLGKTSRPRKARTEAQKPAHEEAKVEACIVRADGPEHRDAKAEEPPAPARANADDSRAAADAEKPARRGYISNETRRQVFARTASDAPTSMPRGTDALRAAISS